MSIYRVASHVIISQTVHYRKKCFKWDILCPEGHTCPSCGGCKFCFLDGRAFKIAFFKAKLRTFSYDERVACSMTNSSIYVCWYFKVIQGRLLPFKSYLRRTHQEITILSFVFVNGDLEHRCTDLVYLWRIVAPSPTFQCVFHVW